MRAKTSVQQNFEVYSLEIKLRMDFGILRPNCKLQKPPVAYLRGDNLGVSQRIPSPMLQPAQMRKPEVMMFGAEG